MSNNVRGLAVYAILRNMVDLGSVEKREPKSNLMESVWLQSLTLKPSEVDHGVVHL